MGFGLSWTSSPGPPSPNPPFGPPTLRGHFFWVWVTTLRPLSSKPPSLALPGRPAWRPARETSLPGGSKTRRPLIQEDPLLRDSLRTRRTQTGGTLLFFRLPSEKKPVLEKERMMYLTTLTANGTPDYGNVEKVEGNWSSGLSLVPSPRRHSWHSVIGALSSLCVLRRQYSERKVVVCPYYTHHAAHVTHSVVLWLQKTYTFL